MKKMSRTIKSAKLNGATQWPRVDLYRRFIPDARPTTHGSVRGQFWQRVWLNMRAAP